MLKHFTGRFLKGFFALLPILLSLYILIWFLNAAENAAKRFLLFYLPDQVYLPGLGIVAAVAVIYMFGNLIDKPGARRIFRWIEEPFQIVPMVRTVYQAIKDFTSYLQPKRDRLSSRVVAVKLPGIEAEVVGMVTREKTLDLPAPLGGADRVAVYLPMSYQFGGYTIFIEKSRIREIDLSTEKTMRSVLTAWMAGASVDQDNQSAH